MKNRRNKGSVKMKQSREEELLQKGWKRQSTYDDPRLSEQFELYRSLGFEVLLEPLHLEEAGEGCTACYKAAPGRFRTIYIRKKEEKKENQTG